MKVDAILLAAGLSKRMLGPNKLLSGHYGKAVIANVYEAVSESGVGKTVVVTGRDEKEVQEALKLKEGHEFIHNDQFKDGMTSSIKIGLGALVQSEAVMICLGDMPWLKTEDYNELVQAFRREGGEDKILVPWFEGKRANPVIFGRNYFDAILVHNEPNGCNAIVQANVGNVLNLKVESERFIRDIDTPDDLWRLTPYA